MSGIAIFHVIFSFNIIVFCAFLSNTLVIANPEISFTNGASIFINFCSFGFRTICSVGKNGIDLFKKLKDDSHEFIIPSNSNIFFMPNTKSTFSCISETNAYISNLWSWISIIIGMLNNTLMNCPFPT